MNAGERCTIVYDGQCRFCQRQMAWITRRDRGGAFEFIPSQTPGLLERFPTLAGEDFNTGLRVVLPDSDLRKGADAVYEIARRLPRWRRIAWVYRLPGVRQLSRVIYGWIAARRYTLAGRCDQSCAASPSTRQSTDLN